MYPHPHSLIGEAGKKRRRVAPSSRRGGLMRQCHQEGNAAGARAQLPDIRSTPPLPHLSPPPCVTHPRSSPPPSFPPSLTHSLRFNRHSHKSESETLFSLFLVSIEPQTTLISINKRKLSPKHTLCSCASSSTNLPLPRFFDYHHSRGEKAALSFHRNRKQVRLDGSTHTLQL